MKVLIKIECIIGYKSYLRILGDDFIENNKKNMLNDY